MLWLIFFIPFLVISFFKHDLATRDNETVGNYVLCPTGCIAFESFHSIYRRLEQINMKKSERYEMEIIRVSG